MNETINLHDIGSALSDYILIASACSALTGKKKRLTFTPDDSTYYFRYEDKNSQTTVMHKHPADAIEVYNRHVVLK